MPTQLERSRNHFSRLIAHLLSRHNGRGNLLTKLLISNADDNGLSHVVQTEDLALNVESGQLIAS